MRCADDAFLGPALSCFGMEIDGGAGRSEWLLVFKIQSYTRYDDYYCSDRGLGAHELAGVCGVPGEAEKESCKVKRGQRVCILAI